ncbi:uncharacterized protein L201_002567 [Kwoniella dendrophila CBS 6074]|uniref:Metallo-beta-lactamase domain-containing protein n=1 Tax=Kwoniella dendrophila CBS 6074 TaxID=1295534 RepID=A0AAX4JQI2_9TREE
MSSSSSTSSEDPLQLLFMGTGTSTGLPLTPCLTLSNPYPESFSDMVPLLKATNESSNEELKHKKGSWEPNGKFPKNIPCPCCRSAIDPDVPEGWKNKRGNTGCLIRKTNKKNGQIKNLLVDVGKTFREQAARFFPVWDVKTIDAVLLTHGHADAYFGLDDLREWCIRQGRAIPVYLNQETYEKVCEAFPYMVDKTKASGGGDVPQLLWRIIKDDDELEIEGIDVKVLAVHHGIYFHTVAPTPTPTTIASTASSTVPVKRLEPEPLICLGFMFDSQIIYISDVSSIPETTWERMLHRNPLSRKAILPTPENTPVSKPSTPITNGNGNGEGEGDGEEPLPILIIDALWPLRPHASHFSLQQALKCSLRLKAKFTYLIGSTHPTTHYMWEEICNSLLSPTLLSQKIIDEAEKKEREEHPDKIQSDYLVKKVWDKVLSKSKSQQQSNNDELGLGLGELWKRENRNAIVRPAWDGLVLQVPGYKSGKIQDLVEVERKDLSTRGLVY